jgi:hypothetical protein
VYRDSGLGGPNCRDDRPGLDKALREALQARYDALAVWSVARCRVRRKAQKRVRHPRPVVGAGSMASCRCLCQFCRCTEARHCGGLRSRRQHYGEVRLKPYAKPLKRRANVCAGHADCKTRGQQDVPPVRQ